MRTSKEFILGIFITILIVGFSSCDKEKLQPMLSLANVTGYLANDTILQVGDTVKVMLDINWNGKHKVKEVKLKVNDQLAGEYPIDIDNGQFSITIIKGLPELEVWDFTIIDDGGNSNTITLNLTKDPDSKYSALKYFDSINLGAQLHVNRQGFMSLTNSTYYNLDGAYVNQDKIDLLFYYNDEDKATLASPGANINEGTFAAEKAPGSWVTKNTTRFQNVDMVPEVFFGLFHDAFILENFDVDLAKRKAKNLAAGDVYMFQLENGKKGILYINSIVEGTDGEVNFALKIQE